MKTLIAGVLTLLSLTTQAATPPAHLSLDAATIIADAAAAAARARQYAVVVSVFDQHGNLKHFQRMDGTSVGSIQVSQLKALTSAQFPVDTATLAQRSASLPANPYASVPGFLLLEGGLPIFNSNKQHVGSIGISGATPELDKTFAQAGLEAYAACKTC